MAVKAKRASYDAVVGDLDCGFGMKRGAEAVLKMLKDANYEAK
jgi:hypothetical protein